MTERFDLFVIGGGPGGQSAAVCAAQLGCKVAVVEREPRIGGGCVHRGTIPSKALRESALALRRFREQAEKFGMPMATEIRFSHVRDRLDAVIDRHVDELSSVLTDAAVAVMHGHARFVGPHEVEVRSPTGKVTTVSAEHIVVATGSRPRATPELVVDHEQVLDSDSVLGLDYLPRSLVIVGGGVIACEYASIFATLGVRVTIVDRARRPLAFLDRDLSAGFVREFERSGGRYLGERSIVDVSNDGFAALRVVLDDGDELFCEKVLVALGRTPTTRGLGLDAVGIKVDMHGRIPVDANCRTVVPSIYAVGDVIGPPALASFSMEQGRRAASHALGHALTRRPELVPAGIFTVPELAAVGETEDAARERLGEVLVGRADFASVARGHIAGDPDGSLKLVADATGERLLGVGIVGEGATELVHLGMLVLVGSGRVRDFVENAFNFPTMAEAYRIAAIDILDQARRVRSEAAA